MKGQVLEFSIRDNTGVVTAEDGERYRFLGDQWNDARPPTRGMRVDFAAAADGTASAVYKALNGNVKTKDKVAAGLLAIFLGPLGIHKFYLGFTGAGLVYLLTNTVGLLLTWIMLFIPNFVLGIMCIVEGILYLTKSDDEFEERYVRQRQQWF